MTSCISPGSSLPDSVVEPKSSQSIYRDLAPLGDLLWGRRYCGGGLSWRSAITSSSPIARHLSAIAQHDAEVYTNRGVLNSVLVAASHTQTRGQTTSTRNGLRVLSAAHTGSNHG